MSIEASAEHTQEAQPSEQPKLPQDQDSHQVTPTDQTGRTQPEENSQNVEQKKAGRGGRRLGDIAAAPFNGLAHMLGSQSFLPMAMDKECEKASKILQTFCNTGVEVDPDSASDSKREKAKDKAVVKIPPEVIYKSIGLAIFTSLRVGMHLTGTTGSGLLVARLPDGSWSPPSGIQVHAVGGGVSMGLNMYDCVCVINTQEALDAFMKSRVGLGSDLAVSAGPFGAGGNKQHRGRSDEAGQATKSEEKKPVLSYVKARGFYVGVQVDGTLIVERKDANERFYGSAVSVDQILKGQVPAKAKAGMWPSGANVLYDTLRGAENGTLSDK